MKKWFIKNKVLLILLGISLLIIYLGGIWFLSIVVKKQEYVLSYYETGTVSGDLNNLIFPVAIVLLFSLVFIASTIIIFLRTLFPNSKAFNALTLKSDRDFIKNLPRNIRKEVMRDE